MSEKTNEYENQAEQLKQVFNELQQHAAESKEISSNQAVEDDLIPKIDVLNLPPRKEVHGHHNSRTRLSLSRPFLRFLTVIILMIVIIFCAYFIWGEELINIIDHLK